MKIPTLKQQLFGDLNRQLNNKRRQMNNEIREQMLKGIGKKRITGKTRRVFAGSIRFK